MTKISGGGYAFSVQEYAVQSQKLSYYTKWWEN